MFQIVSVLGFMNGAIKNGSIGLTIVKKKHQRRYIKRDEKKRTDTELCLFGVFMYLLLLATDVLVSVEWC